MKNKPFYLLATLLLVLTTSCSTNNGASAKLSDLVLGDSILRDVTILDQIHKTCIIERDYFRESKTEPDVYTKNCIWNQLTFDYEKISRNKQMLELFKDDQSSLYIKNFPTPISGRSNYRTYLFIEKKGKKDSMLVYKEDNLNDPLRISRKVFLIEKNHLITLEVDDAKPGMWDGIYRKYKIDLKRGKFRKTYKNRLIRRRLEPEPDYKLFNSIDARYHGKFSASVQTEATTTGMASITYYFSIADKVIEMETSTYHEPLLCNGKYKTIDKDSILELYFTGKETNCPTNSPMFLLKEENGDIFAQGLGAEGTYRDWIKLKKE